MSFIKYIVIILILIGTKGFTQDKPSELDSMTAQRDIYKSVVESYRESDRVQLDLQEFNHKKELERIKTEYEQKLAERDEMLIQQNQQIQKLKAPVYKPIKVEYTGGEGLKRWTLPSKSQKKTN